MQPIENMYLTSSHNSKLNLVFLMVTCFCIQLELISKTMNFCQIYQ